MAVTQETDIALAFDATQEARHAALLRANEVARALVERSRAAAAGQQPDDDGEVPGPQRLRIVVGYLHEDKSTKQRAFLHGVVLPQIAEQFTFPDGSRYAAPVWKEHFRARLLGDKWVLRKAIKSVDGKMVQAKRATPHRVRVSTEDLSLLQYSQYIDRVIDLAVTELGVTFDFVQAERDAVRHAKKARAKKPVQQAEEATA
jgi:hypothetical protein